MKITMLRLNLCIGNISRLKPVACDVHVDTQIRWSIICSVIGNKNETKPVMCVLIHAKTRYTVEHQIHQMCVYLTTQLLNLSHFSSSCPYLAVEKHYGALILCAVVVLMKVYRWLLPCGFCSRVSPVELLLWRMLLLWGWQVVERCCSGPGPELEPELEPKPAEEPSLAGPTPCVPTPSLKNHGDIH